jgi:GNAT superfamily N-acetyltransferase
MSYPKVENYKEYFQTKELKKLYNMYPNLFAPIPPILSVNSKSRIAVEIMSCDLGYLVKVLPALENRLKRSVDYIDWKKCCETSDGIKYLLNTLGIPTSRYRTMTTTKWKNQEEYERLCIHDILLACDGETFIKPKAGLERAIKITPNHPLWDPEIGPPERPFRYVVVEDGEVIANASVKRIIGIFEDNLWAMGVGVKPEWRRRGLGKIVSAAATQEVLDLGGLALWNTQADNIGSLSIAKSLGYETVSCHITIPKYVVVKFLSSYRVFA